MKILSISHLFPNYKKQNFGVFVKERLKYIADKTELNVIAPVMRFPFCEYLEKYRLPVKSPRAENIDGISVLHPKYFSIPKFFKNFDGWFYYLSLNNFMNNCISRFGPDILDLHWVYPDTWAALKWAGKFNKKIIVTARGNESIYYFNSRKGRQRIANILQNVDHVICVSQDLKNKLVEDYGLTESNISVIPNGIDEGKFHFMDKIQARQHIGLKQDKKYILSLCRLSLEKRIGDLIKAFAILKPDDTELIIAGDGPEGEKLEILSEELKVDARVRFVGEVKHEDAAYWFNAADEYCLPSSGEGCPNTVIESLACGTPVVATNVGGIPDLINEDNGILVPPKDPKILAKKIEEALNRDWDREIIAKEGQKRTWDKVAKQVIEVYEKVLGVRS